MIRSGKKMYVYMSDKKSLKTPKMQSESANRRRTDNTMARRERKERTNNDLQNTTKKTKDWATQTPLKQRGDLRCSGRINSSCSTSCTRHVALVINPVISYKWGKIREMLTTNGTFLWSFVTQLFRNGQPSHGGVRKTFEEMIST